MIKEFIPLRFVLILMIVFHHIADFAGGGAPAVSFFFVLSGFCMMLGYRTKIVDDSFDYFVFVKKRLFKIFPLHVITLFAVCFLSFSLDRVFIANFFLMQSWIPDTNFYFSYNAVSWYLSSAIFSYLLFPLVVFFLEKMNVKNKILFLMIILIMYCVLVYCLPISYRHPLIYINPLSRCFDFVIGIYLAYFFNYIMSIYKFKIWSETNSLLLTLTFLLFFLILVSIGVVVKPDWRTIQIIYWFPICICVLCVSITSNTTNFLSRFFRNKVIQFLSKCSFSFMMWHYVIAMYPIKYRCFNFFYLDEDTFSILFQFCLSYIVAQISYYIIEIKVTGLLNKI